MALRASVGFDSANKHWQGYRLKLAYEYQYGQLSRIKDANDPNTVPWQLNAMDAAGRVLDETLGAGVRVVSGFNATTGRLSSRQAGVGGGSGIQNLIYEWDPNDNLSARRDYQQLPPVYETFAYDGLDRIDYSQRNGVTNVDVAYDALGNVTSKSDVGSYTYDATKIHAVTAAGSNSYAYDANGNMTSRNASNVTWFSYDLPMRIYAPGSVTYLQYGPDRSLWRQEATTSGVTETTTYVGDVVEKVSKDGVTTWKHYVEAPTGTAAVYLRRSGGTPAAETYYLTHDHLGSTDKVLDAAGGVVTVAESFTALGARRGSTWQGTPTPAELAAIAATTRDGFTGHETLDSVGLVHMGGRVYDPVIGRFLSVDPVVRDIGAAQSWNSYGYVEGRVVSATDPTGYEAQLENVVFTFQRDPCISSFGILCNVNVGWEFRQWLQNWSYPDPSGGSLFSQIGPVGPDLGTPNESNPPPQSQYDIDKAVAHSIDCAGDKSTGLCARRVREAIEAGGIIIERTTYAKNYGPSLERAGFSALAVGPDYHPQKGDIAIIQPLSGRREGHMQMYSGERWISDFRQNQNFFYPSAAYRAEQPDYEIYRYGP